MKTELLSMASVTYTYVYGLRRLSKIIKQLKLPNKLGGYCQALGCFWPTLPPLVCTQTFISTVPSSIFKFLFLFYLPNSLFLLGNACPSIPGSEFPHQVSGIPMRSYFILGARQQVRLLYCSVPRQWHTDTCITSVVFLASSPIILTCILLHNMPPAMFFSFSYPL